MLFIWLDNSLCKSLWVFLLVTHTKGNEISKGMVVLSFPFFFFYEGIQGENKPLNPFIIFVTGVLNDTAMR